MAGSTPIYGFPYPESSDLVANYPALGQDLAEDVETVIAALPPGGLAHIATESFSAVSSVSLNGVFTSDYDNYRIGLDVAPSTGMLVDLRMRASGSDNSTNNYYANTTYFTPAGASANYNFTNGGSSGCVAIGVATNRTNSSFDMFNPARTLPTNIAGSGTFSTNGFVLFIRHSVNTVFDGFSLIASTGNITGTIRVYGYANS